MKWQSFFLLFFLIPTLIYGLDQKKCISLRIQTSLEWKRHQELIAQSDTFGENEREQRLSLLNESLTCCKRAVGYCEEILKNITKKSKKKRGKPWHLSMQIGCERDKNHLDEEIDHLEILIHQIQSVPEILPVSSQFTPSCTATLPPVTQFHQIQPVPEILPISSQFTPSYTATPLPVSYSSTAATKWKSDVRLDHKFLMNRTLSFVDVVTGAFYVDEADLLIPGPFPLKIRRNYNSQNPLVGDFGCGWKLSLNPFLVEQDGKRLVAETDGTVITYSYNWETSRWEVFSEDNPDLSNSYPKEGGNQTNPFHSYIENDVLYGSDGSKRFFEDNLLKKWVNAQGNSLVFSYDEGHLSRIESFNGDFFGLRYHPDGMISEIYTKDGRSVFYDYNSDRDLIKVTFPQGAVIFYEYDQDHRMIRETRPHGKILENVYDVEGRIKEQKAPMGALEEMIVVAIFDYEEGSTTFTDSAGGKTIYKIFDSQIYKITDPLGGCTFQSWFIDEKSWFDAKSELLLEWNQKGGFLKSLKDTTDKRGLITSYLYDDRGNVEEIGTWGEDLNGNGESGFVRKFTYNDLNLCIRKEHCGQKTLTTYDLNFPYLPKKIEKSMGDTLISFIDREYNSLGQVEKEDNCGAITFWKYDERGFPYQKTQLTGSDDPEVITTYVYNDQGQCLEIASIDAIEKNVYDLMGNQTESKQFSSSGTFISATYMGYDLNHSLIWKRTANSENIVYFDYYASGLMKALRQFLPSEVSSACTFYEYDSCGHLIKEIDPRGYYTCREYDALGRVKTETKQRLSTRFSYEPGGLVQTITSPSGGQTTRHYTTNGLLKEEIFPDGMRNLTVYDFWERPILETKSDSAWKITYDDANHRHLRTSIETKNTEISEFDMRGNLTRFTDAAGYTLEKTYDSLNRVKTEISPSGQKTVWNYRDNIAICTLANGDVTTTHYEAGRVIKSETLDSRGQPTLNFMIHLDPKQDREELIQGEEVTITWKNVWGLPIKIEKRNGIASYQYDLCGRCIAFVDTDGRRIERKFDGLGRLIQKKLPDETVMEYEYDLDSNLVECRLSNGSNWKASYTRSVK